jgi:hypothetical protein
MPNFTTMLLTDAVDVCKARGGLERMNGHSGRAHGATGRAELAEEKPNTGNASALHSVAARAHAEAASRTSGSLSERHQQASEYHARRAAALNGENDGDVYAASGTSKGGSYASFTGPRPEGDKAKRKCGTK